ncbi:MAG: hypothetical protein JWO24_3571, partial [Rhodospirillales bacterium]|nr:hypothetical protein [Rhodospirillales bacterium]
ARLPAAAAGDREPAASASSRATAATAACCTRIAGTCTGSSARSTAAETSR